MKELGVYIHIPFCLSKCKYCSFNSFSGMLDIAPDYVKSLCSEIIQSHDKFKDYVITTIYIGGGTPSVLPTGSVSTILSTVKSNYNVLNNAEITIEANPNSITYEKCLEWKMSGVNRVSVGLQSDKLTTLKAIGRTHSFQDYVLCMQTLKSVGITNINTDLMIGLPHQKQSDIHRAIDRINKLGATHISCYCLILEEGTPLFDEVNNGITKLPSEDKTLNYYNYVCEYLHKLGFDRYEVSNFAKNGYMCKHNLNTWGMVDYIGFGASAHSFCFGKRFNNEYDPHKYIDMLNHKLSPNENIEEITNKELLEETIMLGLRKTTGISLKEINEKFGVDLRQTKQKEIAKLIELGLVIIDHDNLSATDYGFCVLNKVILELVE